MSPSSRISFATPGRTCGDPIHGTGLSADIERDLCKEPKVAKLGKHGTYLIHAANAGIRGGGRVDAVTNAPKRRTSSMSVNPGSPLKTMQLALPELDAAARTSPTEGKEVRLNTPKNAFFPSSNSNATNATKARSPQKDKEESLDNIIDDHLARRGYGNRSVVFHQLDKKRTSTVVHHPFTSANYIAKQEAPPAAMWAKKPGARKMEGKSASSKTYEGSQIEDDWQEVEKDDDEWTMV